MSLNDRDYNTLKHIIDYCEEIEKTVNRFSKNYDCFNTDSVNN